MCKNLQVLENRIILNKEFAIYGDTENPLFLAKDIADMIGHSNTSKMVNDSDLNDDEKVLTTSYTLGGTQKQLFLTENGLYEVLMQSRKPIAKEFKKEVKLILKSVRHNGAYIKGATATETKIIVKQYKASKYLTEAIHDKISVRKLIKETDPMLLKAVISDIKNITQKMKADIKNEILTESIKQLDKINNKLQFDTPESTYIKSITATGVRELQDINLGKTKRKVVTLETKLDKKTNIYSKDMVQMGLNTVELINAIVKSQVI